ncbi:MAG: hypothetical protein HWD61_12180 [Parachlamydiaceae bacterium]|nr:MAG: hypothetical protein HWD61_12180 [Parachlamydiaceae bacterium]
MYMARAAGKLACEFIVDFFTTPAFAIAGPFARAPKVLCSGKEKFDSWIKN